MILYLLKIDFSLSMWFARKDPETAIRGTVYFFLSRIWLIVQSLYFILLPQLPFKLSAETVTILIAIIVAVIMYGGQKSTKRLIFKHKLQADYKKISTDVIDQRKYLGLISFVGLFFLNAYNRSYSF